MNMRIQNYAQGQLSGALKPQLGVQADTFGLFFSFASARMYIVTKLKTRGP